MSAHYSPFHRGPDDHDPPPPYVPPLPPSAPSTDELQNQANERAETRHRNACTNYMQQISRGGSNRQSNTTAPRQQYSMTSSSAGRNGTQHQSSFSQGSFRQNSSAAAVPPEPPAGPFYGGPPPAGPFYSSNGSSSYSAPAAPAPAPAPPRVYPSLQQQTSQNSQLPSGPLYPSSGRFYNNDTEGVSSYGATSTGGNTMFNAMPSRVESTSDVGAGAGGGGCCNIL